MEKEKNQDGKRSLRSNSKSGSGPKSKNPRRKQATNNFIDEEPGMSGMSQNPNFSTEESSSSEVELDTKRKKTSPIRPLPNYDDDDLEWKKTVAKIYKTQQELRSRINILETPADTIAKLEDAIYDGEITHKKLQLVQEGLPANGDIIQFEQRVERNESNIGSLKEEIKELKDKIAKYEENMKNETKKVDSFTKKLEEKAKKK